MVSAIRITVIVCLLGTLTGLYGQQIQADHSAASVPRVVRITGGFRPANGLPTAPVEGVMLSIYKDENDRTPLWQETQNVALDAEGRYTILMGATSREGMPVDLFNTAEPRWLGVQFNRPGESEQPRVLLVSVPYALKAADADTLGGKPASAYLLSSGSPADEGAARETTSGDGKKRSDPPDSINAVSSGTAGYIGKFVNPTDLGNSLMFDTGSGIGIGTTNPLDRLHVQFTDTSGTITGYTVQNLGTGAGAYSGMLFYDQNGALGQFQGFNNSTHEYRINNIASGGSINFMIGSSSKFLVANNGNIGVGTAVPETKLDVVGTVKASSLNLPSTASDGTGVLTVNGIRFLHNFGTDTFLGIGAGNFTASSFRANTGLGNFTLQANTTGGANTAAGVFALAENSTGSFNTAMGYGALRHSTVGGLNAATGMLALTNNSSGQNNTANGVEALSENTTGSNNTALGRLAGVTASPGNANLSGSNNTFLGYQAGPGIPTQLSNATAVGSNALVASSDTLVLGAPNVNVAIGAATAMTKLQVVGDIRVGTSGTDGCVQDFSGGAIAGTCSSDVRLKQDIKPFAPVLDKLIQMQPVSYAWRTDEHPEYHFGPERTKGLIAQDVEKLFPDMVAVDGKGYKAVNYSELPLLLLQAMRELKAENDSLRSQNEKLVSQDEKLRSEMDGQRRQLQSQLDAIMAVLNGGGHDKRR